VDGLVQYTYVRHISIVSFDHAQYFLVPNNKRNQGDDHISWNFGVSEIQTWKGVLKKCGNLQFQGHLCFEHSGIKI